jgi:hypothetical protein
MMNKQLKLLTCLVIFMLVAIGASPTFVISQVGANNSNSIADATPTGDPTPSQTTTPTPDTFSIMQISDTQFLCYANDPPGENIPWNPNLFNDLTTWIANNSAVYNLKMVVHTGDIVDVPNDNSQWNSANTAMNILSSNGVPYCWCAGNHDQCGYDNPNSGWIGNQYAAFNPATFNNLSYWIGDDVEGKSTAVTFSVGNYNFLIIDIECQASSTTLSWMTNLLNIYSKLNYNIIVATHAFLAAPNADFTNYLPYSPTWEQNLQNLLNNYPRVFMTLNGHSDWAAGGNGVGLTCVHDVVDGREQIEFNRQEVDNEQGACSARIYTFDLNNQTVSVSTYSVWDSTWLTASSGNSFSFSPNLTSTPTANITPTHVRMYTGQSQTFTSSITGGTAPYSYQWILNGTIVSGATKSNWTFTPIQTGNYNIYLNVTDSLNNKAQSNIVSDAYVHSINLLLVTPQNQATYQKGQTVNSEVEVFNQLNPPLQSTLTLTVTGPGNYNYFDFQTINLTANAVNEYSFTWNIPNVAGTYVVSISLVPAQLTAYDEAWLKVA